MAQIDLGKLKFQWKGQYADSTAYEIDDVVFDQGSAWVVVAAVASSNTKNPKENGAFEIMQQGINNAGVYAAGTTYYYGDVVTYNNGSYIRKDVTASSGVAPTTTSTWLSLVGAPPGSVTTTSGDIAIRNNQAVLTRLPIGTKGQVLTATEDFLETFANGGDGVDYIVNAPTAWAANTAYALNDTVTADNGKMYICDQAGTSAASGSGPSGTGSDITDNGARWDYVQATAGRTANLELVGTSTNVGGGDHLTNASITLTRGKEYKFVFPANSKTYSIKDTTVSGYETGTTGRLTTAQGVDVTHITNGGTITFTPSTNTSTLAATTVAIRDESSSATTDFVTITLVPQRLTPKWSGAASTGRNWGGWMCTNNIWNTYTDDIEALPTHLKTFGRGGMVSGNYQCTGYRQGGYISVGGDAVTWGNHYHDGNVYSGYGSWGISGHANSEDVRKEVRCTGFRMPNYWFKALAGDTDYEKFLKDVDGKSLNYDISSGHPRIIQAMTSSTQCMFLLENGMAFHTGYNSVGGRGNNTTTPHSYKAYPIPFHDKDGNILTGANIPFIKQIGGTIGGDKYGNDHTYAAVDTNGNLYTWGTAALGKLGHGSTTNRYKAQALDPALFAVSGTNKKITSVYTVGRHTQGTTFAIDEDGNLWGWGANGNGILGDDSTTDRSTPVNINAVSGSGLSGKKVIHVCGTCGDTDNQGKAWALTSEGKVYFSGYRETNGIYTGHYDTNSTSLKLFTEIYNSANTINSTVNGTAQKAIAIWPTGGEHGSVFIQTDGGGTPAEPRVYSAGMNTNGQLGNAASITHGASNTAVGNWTLKEIEFDDAGSFQNQGAGGDPGDRKQGTQWSSLIKTSMAPGKIVKVIGNMYSGGTINSTMALDEHGNIYWAGYLGVYNLANYYENDNVNDGIATAAYINRFVRIWEQPEPMADIAFAGHEGGTQTGWQLIGKSGTVYTGGYQTWGQNCQDNANHGMAPIAVTASASGSTR